MAYKCALLCLLVLLPQCLTITTPYLVFSSWFTVSRMTLDGSGYEELVEYGGSVGKQAVDYHWRLNLLFWTHYIGDTVNQASLDGSDATVIASGVDTPNGLAVDWINDNLYFSYAGSTSYHLAVYSITGGGNWEVILTSSSRFYEIAVDPVGQWLYWTTGHSIVRSTLSGSNSGTIFTTTTLDCVFSLALNTQLYWTERCFGSSLRSIRSLNLTTLSESAIIEDASIDPYFGVAVFEDAVFWTGNAAVYTTLAAGGGTASQVLHIPSYGGAQFRGIVVVDPALQPDPRNLQSASSTVGLTAPTTVERGTSAVTSYPTGSVAPPTTVLAATSQLPSSLTSYPPTTTPSPATTTPSTAVITSHTSTPPTSTTVISPPHDVQSTSSSTGVGPTPPSSSSDNQSTDPATFIKNNPVVTALVLALTLASLALVSICIAVIVRRKRKVGGNADEKVPEPVDQRNMWIIPNNEAVGEDMTKPPVPNSSRPPITLIMNNSQQKSSSLQEEGSSFYELDDVDSDMSSLHVGGTATSFLPHPGAVIAAPSSAPQQPHT